MKQVVEWCNNNAGFLTGIQTILTSIISIAAVLVSIQAIRHPFTKKILFDWAIDGDERGEVLYLQITNIGHAPIKIKEIVANETLGRKIIKHLGRTEYVGVRNDTIIFPENTHTFDVVFCETDINHMYGNKESKITIMIEIEGKQKPFIYRIPWIYG